MELPTFTSIFHIERKLYAIYDVELPFPIGVLQAGSVVGSLLATVLLLHVIGIPLSAGTGWLYIVPPGVAGWAASQPVADGKRLHTWLYSQLRYVCEPRVLVRLRRWRGPAAVWVTATTWRPRP